MAKGNMRDLDVVNESGAPLPVLGRNENAYAATSALFTVIEAQHEPCLRKRFGTLHFRRLGDPSETKAESEQLLNRLNLDETVGNLLVFADPRISFCARCYLARPQAVGR